jgi:hypothetical protein
LSAYIAGVEGFAHSGGFPDAFPRSEGAGEAAATGARFRLRPWGRLLVVAWLTDALRGLSWREGSSVSGGEEGSASIFGAVSKASWFQNGDQTQIGRATTD